MTRGSTLSGSANPFQAALRAVFLIAATIGGFFIFAASAAFALFVVMGILILGFIVFVVFWLRAKITGKPLMPKAKMYGFNTFGVDPRSTPRSTGSASPQKPAGDLSDGPVLDARQTPDGWSVDTE